MGGEQADLVEVVTEEVVLPARPSPQAWLALSPCDLLMRDINYTRRVLFYRRPASQAAADVTTTLRDSLAQALAHFFPLAGRLALQQGRLAVHCNDAGAEFVQARLRPGAPSIRQLQASRFAMQPFFSHLARWGSYFRSLHEGSAPLLSIQVTTFPCGGIALGIALSHVIADGTSFWHFLSSWADCAQGKLPSMPPTHKRHLLGTHYTTPSAKKPGLDFFEDLHDHTSQKRERKVGRSFSVSKEMVEKMKEDTQHQYSAYEVASAHIWKHTNKAWNHSKDTKVGYINVVNMRERMIPPLPRGYFGNAILWSIATATSGQLNDEELATTAGRIHDAVAACTPACMQDFLELLERYTCFTDKILQPLNCNGVRMRVSSSTKFPVASVNFGWGMPLAARSASVEEINKIAFYPDTCAPGSITFCLALPRNIMETLQVPTRPEFFDGKPLACNNVHFHLQDATNAHVVFK